MSILGYCTLTTDSAELDHNPQSIAKETASAHQGKKYIRVISSCKKIIIKRR